VRVLWLPWRQAHQVLRVSLHRLINCLLFLGAHTRRRHFPSPHSHRLEGMCSLKTERVEK
jgi:hypothetical protein